MDFSVKEACREEALQLILDAPLWRYHLLRAQLRLLEARIIQVQRYVLGLYLDLSLRMYRNLGLVSGAY